MQPVFALIKILLVSVGGFSIAESKCDAFHNVKVQYSARGHKNVFEQTVDGCLERKAFDLNRTVTELFFTRQDIRSLKTDAIKHLVRLDRVVFEECPIEVLEFKCFRNVPRLTYLEFSFSKIRLLPVGVLNELQTLEELKIGNKLEEIEVGAIANVSMLNILDLSGNLLKEFNREWFVNSSSLTHLKLDRNNIRKIPKNAFINLSKLKYISFDNNDLTEINPEAFRKVTKLEYLGLRYNRLKRLDPRIFPNVISIDDLRIDANQLNFVPSEIFDKLKVKTLVADGNPWLCPCWNLILAWLLNDKGILKKSEHCTENIPVCAFPQNSQNCTQQIDEESTKRYYQNFQKIQDGNSDFVSIINNAHCVRSN